MDRRDALIGTGMLALSALAVTDRVSAQEHAHMHHGGGQNNALADAAGACVSKGQVCLNHCLGLLGSGNQELAACATSVSQMLAVCTALQGLANQNSRYLPGLAKVALDVCNDCELECKKHADKHEACKACMESCRECARQCRALST